MERKDHKNKAKKKLPRFYGQTEVWEKTSMAKKKTDLRHIKKIKERNQDLTKVS